MSFCTTPALIVYLLVGVYYLIRGSVLVSRHKTVVGVRARIIGIIFLLPVLLNFVLWNIIYAGQELTSDATLTVDKEILLAIGVAPLVVMGIARTAPPNTETNSKYLPELPEIKD